MDKKYFRYFKKNDDLPLYGWKIHLSPQWEDIDRIKKEFFQWVNKNHKNLSYKIANKKYYYDVLFPKDRKISNILGKYITIY
ncbi:MAG: hypothetical protein HRT99_04355, partial [Mycoplasmatales bacterium]|nr:hypothetical protein [Mycoplasmatales bacterium]